MKYIYIIFIFQILNSCTTRNSEPKKKEKDLTFNIDLNIVYDSPGRGFTLLYPISEIEDSLRNKISTASISPGIYTIEIRGDATLTRKKIIKSR